MLKTALAFRSRFHRAATPAIGAKVFYDIEANKKLADFMDLEKTKLDSLHQQNIEMHSLLKALNFQFGKMYGMLVKKELYDMLVKKHRVRVPLGEGAEVPKKAN